MNFISQGERYAGHAANTGSGESCGRKKRHCGIRLLRSPRDTHCLVAELEVEGVRFTFFANDAASSFTADALPDSYKNGNKVYDLALITIPDSHLTYVYPSNLINAIDPDEIRWVHWEDFIFFPGRSMRRIKNGKPPKTAGQIALPLHVVQTATSWQMPNCFPGHGHIEYFPKRKQEPPES